MAKTGSIYTGHSNPPTYDFTPLEKPLAEILASTAKPKLPDSDMDLEVVHVFPRVDGLPSLTRK